MRSIEELIEASSHLHYEIWMLRIASYELEKYATKKPLSSGSDRQSYTHTNTSVSLYSSSAPITPPSESESKTAKINAYIESFLIHLRSLLNFFYSDPNQAHKEDVLAEHYFGDPLDWYKKRPVIPDEELANIKARVGTEIAHLSFKRLLLSDVDKLWPFIELKTHVLNALKEFVLIVDADLLSELWKNKAS